MPSSLPAPRSSGFVEACLPSAADVPPRGAGWIHKIKYDGYRMMAQRCGSAVRSFTRNWTDRYPALVAAMARLKLSSCLIDGEIAVCDNRGGTLDCKLNQSSAVALKG